MKHTRTVPHFSGGQVQLAEEIGDLYYDSLAELLGMLAEKISRDAVKDRQRGRVKLATELEATAGTLHAAAGQINVAWLICKPYVAGEELHDGSDYDRQLQLAIGLAERAHSGQKDKAGNRYIDHPMAVMLMAEPGIDKIVAILHDVVEDSDITIDEIKDSFGEDVAAAVDAITRRSGEDPGAYYARVKNNEVALRVKHLDLKHNSDPERLALLPPELRMRLAEKYAKARQQLGSFRK